MALRYDPKSASYLSFAAAKRAFAAGSDTPRAFLERCIEQIERREPQIKAFVRLDFEGARQQADASTTRWQRGQPLSAVDGLPVGIKDCFDIAGWPTEVNSALFREHVAEIDAAHVDALRAGAPWCSARPRRPN
jgi:Asp-tRNA(Asn)/Glu-tRNA(Gln) amidotransferase A subunit family amidase